jgi:pyruvoyl-dependent arginine decarboxylase (PvlArgDC)
MNFFITKGSGESNLRCYKNETTSFDAATVNAGLGNIRTKPDGCFKNYCYGF